jgi:hypothetical protein
MLDDSTAWFIMAFNVKKRDSGVETQPAISAPRAQSIVVPAP